MLRQIWRYAWWSFTEVLSLGGIFLFLLFLAALASPGTMQFSPLPEGGLSLAVDGARLQTVMGAYIGDVRQGDLGFAANMLPVGEVVLQGLGRSLTLLFPAVFLALAVGVAKGVADFRRGRLGGVGLSGLSTMAAQALPDFLAAIGLQYLMVLSFGRLGWKPFPLSFNPDEPLVSLVLPVLALAIVPAGFIARLTAVSLEEVYKQDYIRTARGKGCTDRQVTWRHAVRNVLVQVIDGLPGVLASTASNLLVVEYFFSYPGLATTLFHAIDKRGTNPYNLVSSRGGIDIPTVVVGGLALALLFSLLYGGLRLLRRLVDVRLREGGAA